MSSQVSQISSATRATAKAPEAHAKKAPQTNIIKPEFSPLAASSSKHSPKMTTQLARNLQKSDGHKANRLGAILQPKPSPGVDLEITKFIKHLDSTNDINEESLQKIYHYIQEKKHIKLTTAIDFFFAVRKLNFNSNSQLDAVTTKICETISYGLDQTLKKYFPCSLPFRTLSSLCKALVESNYPKNKKLNSSVFLYLKKKIAADDAEWTAKQAVNFFSLFSITLAISSYDKEMPTIKKFMDCISLNLNNLKLKECVTASWCALKLNITNLEYFNAIRARIHPFINDLSATDLTYITRDLAQLHTEDDSTLLALLDEIKKRVEYNIKYYELNDLIAIAHVICIKICQQDINYDKHVSFFKFICGKIEIILAKEDSLNDYARNELKAIFIIYDLLIKGDKLLNIETIAKSKSSNPKPKPKASSELHNAIENELKIFLQECQNPKDVGKLLIFKHESRLAHYLLDIAFPYARTAIEIDGPYHFDENGDYLPETVRKTKILELLDYLVIRISHTEWNESQDKTALLRTKLKPLIQKLEEKVANTSSPKLLEEWQSIKTKLSV